MKFQCSCLIDKLDLFSLPGEDDDAVETWVLVHVPISLCHFFLDLDAAFSVYMGKMSFSGH